MVISEGDSIQPTSPALIPLKKLAQTLPLMLWTCRPDGWATYFSPQWIAYTGVPAEVQLGNEWTLVLHPDDRDRALQRWLAAAREGEKYNIEYRIRRHDGVHRWFKTQAEPYRSDDGILLGWCGSSTDIQDQVDTRDALAQLNRELEERVEARTQELKQSNQNLEALTLELSSAQRVGKLGSWTLEVDTGQVTWSEQLYRMFCLDPNEPIPNIEVQQSTYFTPQDWSIIIGAITQATKTGEGYEIEIGIQIPGGANVRVITRAETIRDENGRVVKLLGTLQDVTEQRKAERAVRQSEGLLREFVKHAPAAIAMLDNEMRYVMTSDRWLTDYKLSEESVLGMCHYEVFPDLPDHWRAIHQRVLSGVVESCQEDPFPRDNGSIEWLQWEARPWLLEDSTIGGLLFFTQVITNRKELELRFRQQRLELERSNLDLSQFAYAASHDLQEPLRAVSGCAQLLRESIPDPDPPTAELIEFIVDGASRMKDLIQDLLEYSQLDSGGGLFANVDSGVALDRALAQLRLVIAETETVVHRPEMPVVSGDLAQLTLLFSNLLGNAIKYRGDQPPSIVLEVAARDDLWEFSVRDNGIGIDAAYFGKIFGMFSRLHTRRTYPGTGIGLALCKKIVERHGGEIWVSSEIGQGSSFCFLLRRTQ